MRSTAPGAYPAQFRRSWPCSPDDWEQLYSPAAGIRLAWRQVSEEMTTNLADQPPTPASAESAVGGTLPNAHWLFGLMPRLNVTLSRFQTFVGLAAGTISIVGAVLAVSSHFFTPTIGKGDLVAVVVDAKTEKAVSNATVEILTLNNAVVTTASSGFFGKANSTLAEGQYRLRVKHPKFGAEIRHVQIVSGQTAEIRIPLHSGVSAPLEAISDGVSAVKRLFGN